MSEILLFPALIGALVSAILSGTLRRLKRRSQGGVVLISALASGLIPVYVLFGGRLLHANFWSNGIKGGPAYVQVLFVFILSALVGCLTAIVMVATCNGTTRTRKPDSPTEHE